ncbi:MAG: glucokinase [Porticoccaceae bacterium]|nr:glucokinase [Porticoccaceae bacterium]
MSVNWSLVADIGGTNARFTALPLGELESQYEFHHSVQEHPEFSDLIVDLLKEIAEATGWDTAPTNACFAVACPADVEEITFTNSHWHFNKTQLKQLLGCQQLSVINDFEAVAHGITELNDKDVVKVGGDQPVANKPIGILGAGTGLGVAGLVPLADGYKVIDTEGGHADYPPITDRMAAVVGLLRKEYGRVSLERLLSGKGIFNIYRSLCTLGNKERACETPAQVVAAAHQGDNEFALQALNMFCAGMGSAAGNIALTLGAKGGIYIAGGVVPRFKEFFINSDFRLKFEEKGRFVNYLKPIPVYIVVRDNLGLLGAAKKLKQS